MDVSVELLFIHSEVTLSVDLKDFRLSITAETEVVLITMARVYGKDRQAIAREVLHDWAARKLTEYSLGADLAQRDGIVAARPGRPPASGGADS